MPPDVASRSLAPYGMPWSGPKSAGRELPLGAPRLVHRALARERDDGIVAGAERLEPMEERLRELDRRHRARADHSAELAKRDEDRLVTHEQPVGETQLER